MLYTCQIRQLNPQFFGVSTSDNLRQDQFATDAPRMYSVETVNERGVLTQVSAGGGDISTSYALRQHLSSRHLYAQSVKRLVRFLSQPNTPVLPAAT